MFDPPVSIYLIAGIGAALVSLACTPVVRAISNLIGFVDRPDGRRKTHKKPVALGGGAAVLLATFTAIGIFLAYAAWHEHPLLKASSSGALGSLAVGAIVIVLLGLLDDFIGLRGRQKLLGQTAVVGLLIYSGVRIEGFGFFGYPVVLGALAIPATAFWLFGTINAINLIDGIDGLAGSVGMILSLTLAAIAGWQGHEIETAILLALAGAQLGFLRYNFAPATIYLGDAGSMLIGLVCGTIAVESSAKSSAAMAFAVPIAVWSIPIIDSFAALIRRKLTGRSLFAADRAHLHHSLLIRGWSVRQASLFIALICATTGLSAVISFCTQNELIALLTMGVVMLFLVFSRTFGHIEFALLKDRVRFLARAFVASDSERSHRLRESCIQLQGSREWRQLWTAIMESAEQHQLVKISLSINVHAIHESFYAQWETTRNWKGDAERSWQITHPLVLDGVVIGQLGLTGIANQGPTLCQIVSVLEFFEPIEEDIRAILEQISHDQPKVRLGQKNASEDTRHVLAGTTDEVNS